MDAVALAGSALETRPAQDRFAARVLFFIEHLGGAILAIDVAVVFLSVVFRYFLHAPFDWAEEVAAGLMTTMVFIGAASVLARSQHIGIEVLVLAQIKKGWAGTEWVDQNESPLGKRRHLELVRRGRLPGVRSGKRILVRRSDLDVYLAAHTKVPVRDEEEAAVDALLADLGEIK